MWLKGCHWGPPARAPAWLLVPPTPLIVRMRTSLQSPFFSVFFVVVVCFVFGGVFFIEV